MKNISIRHPTLANKEIFIQAMTLSRDLHHSWVEAPYSEDAFMNYLNKYDQVNNISYLVCIDEKIAGVIRVC